MERDLLKLASVMKTISRAFAPVLLLLATASLAQAHPGHDGHELTWDLRHLAAHPGATILCFSVIAIATWGLWQATRSGGVLHRERTDRR
jgi:hydrogenase/urease accessory protein HupE